jgi:hypothetical protein
MGALGSGVLSPDSASAERMRHLGLRPEEFQEVFSRSGGPGGQHVNKVSTRRHGASLAVGHLCHCTGYAIPVSESPTGNSSPHDVD